jgi:hypothetical protein
MCERQGQRAVRIDAASMRCFNVLPAASSNTEQTRVLSSKAVAQITRRLQDGDFAEREGAREPPFMAPSTDPDQYSDVSIV